MKIGILSAMEIELQYVLSKLTITHVKEIKGLTMYYAKFENHELVLAICGVGKVNAAIFTQILLDYEVLDLVINIGIAGGLVGVLPLDLVLGTSYCHHDVRPTQMAALFPFQKNFKTRKTLVDQVIKTPDLNLKLGRISSGESFISGEEERENVKRVFQSNAVDMETSAIAHCCFVNAVDVFALRCISDLADEAASQNYISNEQKAADKAGKAVLQIIRKIGEKT